MQLVCEYCVQTRYKAVFPSRNSIWAKWQCIVFGFKVTFDLQWQIQRRISMSGHETSMNRTGMCLQKAMWSCQGYYIFLTCMYMFSLPPLSRNDREVQISSFTVYSSKLRKQHLIFLCLRKTWSAEKPLEHSDDPLCEYDPTLLTEMRKCNPLEGNARMKDTLWTPLKSLRQKP